MAASGGPVQGTIIVKRPVAIATGLVILVVIGLAVAITSASVSRLARTEAELAALRTSGQPDGTAGPTARASSGPSGAPSVRPSSSLTPASSPAPDVAAQVTASLLETCITPLQDLARSQESRLATAGKVVDVFGSASWDNARDGAISGYRTAYLRMKSAAESLHSRLAEANDGVNVSENYPSTYSSGTSAASSGSGNKSSMDSKEKAGQSAITAFEKAKAPPKLIDVSKGCPTASPAP